MIQRSFAVVTLVALLVGTAIWAKSVRLNLPGVDQGYAPTQPIAFSHRLHSGDLQVACLYCHAGAEVSQNAGVPEASICMNCHRFVNSAWDAIKTEERLAQEGKRDFVPPVSAELNKLYRAVGFKATEMRYDDAAEARPIEWVRVHRLPDFVHFEHRRHVSSGIACGSCHGAVETMETVMQVSNLTMGWCVACHRTTNRERQAQNVSAQASTSCVVCHY